MSKDIAGERAHGLQTPWETTTFVIANGTGFTPGAINNTYLNIDVTPTVSALFGLAPALPRVATLFPSPPAGRYPQPAVRCRHVLVR